MHGVTGTFRNGRVELGESVDWPDGTQLEVVPVGAANSQDPNDEPSLFEWSEGFFDRLCEQWGEEPFERPPQGEFEVREDW